MNSSITNRACRVTKIIAVQLHTVIADPSGGSTKIIAIRLYWAIANLASRRPEIVRITAVLLATHAAGGGAKTIAEGIDTASCAGAEPVAVNRLGIGRRAEQNQRN